MRSAASAKLATVEQLSSVESGLRSGIGPARDLPPVLGPRHDECYLAGRRQRLAAGLQPKNDGDHDISRIAVALGLRGRGMVKMYAADSGCSAKLSKVGKPVLGCIGAAPQEGRELVDNDGVRRVPGLEGGRIGEVLDPACGGGCSFVGGSGHGNLQR